MKKKYYLVYKTTNLINGKIYIGKHETYNLDDGYLGSGKLLLRAIKKYGKVNFKREILFECLTRDEMNMKEAQIVNQNFLKRNDIYNLKQGGEGGFDFINNNSKIKSNANITRWKKISLKEKCKISKKISNKLKIIWAKHPEIFHNFHAKTPTFLGKHHTEKTKKKISEKNSIRLRGKRNGAYGTTWMFNEILKQNKRVKHKDVKIFLKRGWKLGRKMIFK